MNRDQAEAVADLLHAAHENAVAALHIIGTIADSSSPTWLPRLVELCNQQAQHLQTLSHTASALMLEGGKHAARPNDSTDD